MHDVNRIGSKRQQIPLRLRRVGMTTHSTQVLLYRNQVFSFRSEARNLLSAVNLTVPSRRSTSDGFLLDFNNDSPYSRRKVYESLRAADLHPAEKIPVN